ncbi:CYFA0S09e03422g1_1 [Cyberlindnera fabianii]|uniref:CYFA0S09e03422g1_1 n=1 Tax=Cyberlindnera fabianii TaxID=36022 RepID=A0A061B5Y0_CYBFA|nr:CYFA0S09e03422g1_1 [Cyberlindnera fabianii]
MVTATATSTVTVPAAPIKEAKGILDSAGIQFSNLDIHFRKGEDVIDPVTGVLKVADKEYSSAKYPEWLPTWDPSQKFAQYSDDFNKAYRDPGLDADPELRSLFPPQSKDKYSIKKLSPKLGSEIRGIQLSELSTQAKNDLALFVAQRGVVVFRNQDLKDKGLEFNKKLGEHFGPLHVHPSSGAPENYPQFHITYRRHDPEEYNKVFRKRTSLNDQWHSDCTFEKYTPSYTFFAMLDGPETGGDTIFSDCIEAYDRLSPTFQKMIHGLKATHSSVEQATQSKNDGGIERREPSTVVHPLVRVHPVLKKKALYVSRFFMQDIEGLKKEESNAILDLLTDHINNSFDLQIRASYEPGTVVVWDNRRVLHTATFDWDTGATRHCYRITPMGERPVEDEEELEEWNK